MISDFGVNLPDGISKLTLSSLADGHATDSIDQTGDYSRLRFLVEMSEGRNRQIRRTFEALGYMVRELHRISFGNYQLGDLKSGEFKEIQK
jgi:23S rRNA pseudouridine2605 synthase